MGLVLNMSMIIDYNVSGQNLIRISFKNSAATNSMFRSHVFPLEVQ